MGYINAFIVGGIFCAIAQILIDKTKMTPARILVLYVVVGAILSALGIYKYIEKFAGAGASVPIIGFGNILAKGAIKAVHEHGFSGIFTGGTTQASAGIAASIFFGFLAAALFSPKEKG